MRTSTGNFPAVFFTDIAILFTFVCRRLKTSMILGDSEGINDYLRSEYGI